MNRSLVSAAVIVFLCVSVSHALNYGTEFTGAYWKMDAKDLNKSKAYVLSGAYYNSANDYATTNADVSQNSLSGAASFFVEGDSDWRLGAAVGFGMMPNVSYVGGYNAYYNGSYEDTYTYTEELENKANYVPVDLYVKYKPADSGFSLFGGAGADYIMASTKIYEHDKEILNNSGVVTVNTWDMYGTFTQNKVVPHVQAGAELYISKWLALGVGAKYVFGGVLDDLTGNVTENGVYQGKNRLIMSGGDHFAYQNTADALAPGDSKFKYDFSGLRINISLRAYF